MKPILEVQHISKEFYIGGEQERYLALRDILSNPFKLLQKSKPNELFKALDDVSFDVYPGESIGIIGRNGAGKSTLLKILSKITPPTSGKIISRGRIASLLEVGTGFHPELTGRENIYMNGSILGMKRAEINKHFDEIVDFSGVEKFLDTPLKRYSSGMQLRLAFAVAAHLEPEILIIDEVLAVGDAEFQKKCLGKMDEVSKSGRTVLFVSHDLGAVNTLCSKAIVLKNGSISFQGNTNDVISTYLKSDNISSIYLPKNIDITKKAYFKKIQLYNKDNENKIEFKHDEPIKVEFDIQVNNIDKGTRVFLIILDRLKKRVFACESEIINEKMTLEIEANQLVRGDYSIHTFIHIPMIEQIDIAEDICTFTIIDNGSTFSIHGSYDYGNTFAKYKWN